MKFCKFLLNQICWWEKESVTQWQWKIERKQRIITKRWNYGLKQKAIQLILGRIQKNFEKGVDKVQEKNNENNENYYKQLHVILQNFWWKKLVKKRDGSWMICGTKKKGQKNIKKANKSHWKRKRIKN